MDASGPIFAVLALACLFYLVPRQLNWRIPTQAEVDEGTRLHLPKITVHAGVPVGQTDTPEVAISTMLMRRAGRRMAMRLARQAARRRRSVFIVLTAIGLATIPLAFMNWMIDWWMPVAVFAVVGLWMIFSRFESRRAAKQLDAIVAEIELGDDEKTMAVQLHPKVELSHDSSNVVGPNGDVQMSLWQPITVVPATYISAPTAARTVRTIDLKAPINQIPLTDTPQTDDQAIAV